MVVEVFEKKLPSFKPNTTDNPSVKLKSMLNIVDSHFESLEKASNARVLNQFNAMRLKTFLKMIENDRVSLITAMKVVIYTSHV